MIYFMYGPYRHYNIQTKKIEERKQRISLKLARKIIIGY